MSTRWEIITIQELAKLTWLSWEPAMAVNGVVPPPRPATPQARGEQRGKLQRGGFPFPRRPSTWAPLVRPGVLFKLVGLKLFLFLLRVLRFLDSLLSLNTARRAENSFKKLTPASSSSPVLPQPFMSHVHRGNFCSHWHWPCARVGFTGKIKVPVCSFTGLTFSLGIATTLAQGCSGSRYNNDYLYIFPNWLK